MDKPKTLDPTDICNRDVLAVLHILNLTWDLLTAEQYDMLWHYLREVRGKATPTYVQIVTGVRCTRQGTTPRISVEWDGGQEQIVLDDGNVPPVDNGMATIPHTLYNAIVDIAPKIIEAAKTRLGEIQFKDATGCAHTLDALTGKCTKCGFVSAYLPERDRDRDYFGVYLPKDGERLPAAAFFKSPTGNGSTNVWTSPEFGPLLAECSQFVKAVEKHLLENVATHTLECRQRRPR